MPGLRTHTLPASPVVLPGLIIVPELPILYQLTELPDSDSVILVAGREARTVTWRVS
jgi:hypothetical protein